MTRPGHVTQSTSATRASTRASVPVASGSTSTDASNPATTESTQQSNEGRVDEGTFAGTLVRQIEAIVESFRIDKIRKSEAIYRIGQVLASEPTGNDELKSNALEQYATTLNGIEALAARSNEHGQRVTDTLLGKRKEESGKGSERHDEPDRNIPNESRIAEVDNFLEGISKENELGGGQFNIDTASGDDSEPESDDSVGSKGRSNKRQRIYESQMPWFNKEQRIRKSATNVSCNKTRKLLDLFQKDPVTVKRWIRGASTAPAGFPSSEWDALIKGESVDLDTVFSSLHHIHSVNESVGHVGTTEIQFGRPKPAAKIETSGQWSAAFNLVTKATSFLYPHRYDELRQYSDYVEELFSAKSVAIHPKLFKYDEAVRYRVGQGQSILLTDRGAFSRYYEAIVAPDGVGVEGTSDGGKANPRKGGKSGEKPDICHRFNGANGCGNSPDKCKYRHICKRCKKSGHGKLECKVAETV
jgi:hypothetical protein